MLQSIQMQTWRQHRSDSALTRTTSACMAASTYRTSTWLHFGRHATNGVESDYLNLNQDKHISDRTEAPRPRREGAGSMRRQIKTLLASCQMDAISDGFSVARADSRFPICGATWIDVESRLRKLGSLEDRTAIASASRENHCR